MIEINAVCFSYDAVLRTPENARALDGVTLKIARGEYVAIVGRNGCGKSTFLKLCNALLLPTGGEVRVQGMDTRDQARLWEIRSRAGMIFQDPESQIIGTTVAEDVAFGPENLGLPPQVIRERVQEALRWVGMERYAGMASSSLSPARKIRLSLAGVLAMQPGCLLLDEAAAMLDPSDRHEIMTLLRRLNRERGVTLLHVTHDMEEAATADRVVVIDGGKVLLDGRPAQVFSQADRMKQAGLDLPLVTRLFSLLNEEGFQLPADMLDPDAAVELLSGMYAGAKSRDAEL